MPAQSLSSRGGAGRFTAGGRTNFGPGPIGSAISSGGQWRLSSASAARERVAVATLAGTAGCGRSPRPASAAIASADASSTSDEQPGNRCPVTVKYRPAEYTSTPAALFGQPSGSVPLRNTFTPVPVGETSV